MLRIDILQDQLGLDLVAFLPELILCTAIVVLLLLRLFKGLDRLHLGWVALAMTVAALAYSFRQWELNPPPLEIFNGPHGLLAYDTFTIYLRIFLFGFAALLIWLSMLTGIPDREDSGDFYCLLLGATVGMSLMASANHLLMVYIGVEMASLPSYALAGFLKGKRQGSEASLKYVVYGGGASGIMLYGISLLAGKFGTAYLPDLANAYASALSQGEPGALATGGASGLSFDPILLLGTLFILIGMAFKLAAVPFHFWCPDVFEGAAAEVGAFLSVASKGAALALAGRFALVLAGLAGVSGHPDQFKSWIDVARYLIPALAFFAALTTTFGNLAAYLQTNLKRLLAYSTIAHAGYMLMGLAVLNAEGAAAVLFYLVAYLFMNLGAFAIVAFLRNQTGSEDLSSYRGLVTRAPLMTVLLTIFLLSLLGIPPLAGFAAKFQILSALFDAGQEYSSFGQSDLGYIMYTLSAILVLNTALSAVYYLKVIKVMILDKTIEEVEGRPAVPLAIPAGAAFYGTILAAMIFVIGIAWNPLAQASDEGVSRFQKAPGPSSSEGPP
jgi:NADH-quinone oxidoreductase subunit N